MGLLYFTIIDGCVILPQASAADVLYLPIESAHMFTQQVRQSVRSRKVGGRKCTHELLW